MMKDTKPNVLLTTLCSDLGMELSGMSGHAIALEEVLEIAKECHIEFKPGDIFFLRCGFTKTWESISLDEKKEYRALTQAHKHRHTGLIQSEAVSRFIWDNHIVAVAGDGVSFEVGRLQPQTRSCA